MRLIAWRLRVLAPRASWASPLVDTLVRPALTDARLHACSSGGTWAQRPRAFLAVLKRSLGNVGQFRTMTKLSSSPHAPLRRVQRRDCAPRTHPRSESRQPNSSRAPYYSVVHLRPSDPCTRGCGRFHAPPDGHASRYAPQTYGVVRARAHLHSGRRALRRRHGAGGGGQPQFDLSD